MDYFVHPSAEVHPSAKVGRNTKIWKGAQIREQAVLGSDCVIGKDVYIDRGVTLGDRVKVENFVSIYSGVTVKSGAFIGPGAVFTNDKYPRSSGTWTVVPTVVEEDASIGANATIVCGVTIGRGALVGAGAVVTKDVPEHTLVTGVPARVVCSVDSEGRPQRAARAEGEVRESLGRAPLPCLRVGVIGVGRMGMNHARVLSAPGGIARLCGVADVDSGRCRIAADRFGIETFPDWRDLAGSCDAVVVATPPEIHYEVAAGCLERGVHVLVEKPIADDLDKAGEMVRLAHARGLVLAVGHTERFNPCFQEMRRLTEGRHIRTLETKRLSPSDNRDTGVDVCLDLLIHDVDMVLSLTNSSAKRARAEGIRSGGRLEHVVAILAFGDGTLATCEASRIAQTRMRQMVATTDDSFITADFIARRVEVLKRFQASTYQGAVSGLGYSHSAAIDVLIVPGAEPLVLELQDFAGACAGGSRPLVSGEDGLRALELLYRISADIENGG